MIENTS